ncbi:MAG: hypothetical protein A2W80_03905 [Candidatus Riflebacteria bacterium GWC2_50_8]|nr:MAG: hypothetical protein A2W80_03905 [Candidatus Riflebacteria bacterium GWC2_50_8]
MNKYKLQSAQYKLPYHYLPQIEAGGNFFRHQSLRWGFAYLCYLHHIAATIVREKPGELFDAGCGDGRLISLLSQQSECNFTGQDCDSRAIDMARALNPRHRFLCGDIADVEETFSLVSCIEVLEHIPDDCIEQFISDLVSRIRPGGKLIIGVPTTNKPMSAKHFRHYEQKTLLAQLAPEARGLQVNSSEFIFNGSDPLYRLYTRLTENRFWFLSIRLFENLMWKRAWTKLRHADPHTGHHLLLCLSKTV